MIRCKACGGDTELLYSNMKDYRYPDISDRRFGIYICKKCGSGVSFPEMSMEELGDHYPDYYANYNFGNRVVRSHLSNKKKREMLHLKRLAGKGKAVKLFEIGCGTGESLYYAKKLDLK